MSLNSWQALPSIPDDNSLETVYRLYAALAETVPLDPEHGLGGVLLYAGRIDAGNRLQIAGSIAGLASLGASADAAVLRQAMRDGAIDFLVNSLEEALRILKNEVRKKQPIAVGVEMDPERLVTQMLSRGVLPDLLPPVGWDVSQTGLNDEAAATLVDWGARRLVEPAAGDEAFVSWSVDGQAAVWLPRLDGIALKVVPEADLQRRRWLRLSARYLGREALRRRGVALSADELSRFCADLGARMVAGEEPIAVGFLG